MPTIPIYSAEYRRIRQLGVRRRRWWWWRLVGCEWWYFAENGKIKSICQPNRIMHFFFSLPPPPASCNSSSIFAEVRDIPSFLPPVRSLLCVCVFVRCTGFTRAWTRDMLMHCTLLLGGIFGNYFLRSLVSGLHVFFFFVFRSVI